MSVRVRCEKRGGRAGEGCGEMGRGVERGGGVWREGRGVERGGGEGSDQFCWERRRGLQKIVGKETTEAVCPTGREG